MGSYLKKQKGNCFWYMQVHSDGLQQAGVRATATVADKRIWEVCVCLQTVLLCTSWKKANIALDFFFLDSL
jgi:hypothetical protein